MIFNLLSHALRRRSERVCKNSYKVMTLFLGASKLHVCIIFFVGILKVCWNPQWKHRERQNRYCTTRLSAWLQIFSFQALFPLTALPHGYVCVCVINKYIFHIDTTRSHTCVLETLRPACLDNNNFVTLKCSSFTQSDKSSHSIWRTSK